MRVEFIFQPMSVKKKPATPKSKAKPPTGPARICYQVKLTLTGHPTTPDSGAVQRGCSNAASDIVAG